METAAPIDRRRAVPIRTGVDRDISRGDLLSGLLIGGPGDLTFVDSVEPHDRVGNRNHGPPVQQEIVTAVDEPGRGQRGELMLQRVRRAAEKAADLRRRGLPCCHGRQDRTIGGGVTDPRVLVHDATGLVE